MGNQPNKGGGGGGSFLKTIIKVLMVFGVMFAIVQVPYGLSPNGIWNAVTNTSDAVSAWAKRVGGSLQAGKLDIGIDLNVPDPLVLEPKDPAIQLGKDFDLSKVLEAAAGIATDKFNPDVAYDRYEWRHWDNVTSCWTVREEVLWRDAKKDEALTMMDKNGVRTTDKNAACEIKGGTWVDPYTGETFTNPSDLDIDHMIPLGYTARAGGQSWDSDKKMDYANDLTYEYHLIAVSASANRSKSDRGPSEWKPREEFHCQYGIAWTVVTNKWGLSLQDSDKKEIQSLLAKCSK